MAKIRNLYAIGCRGQKENHKKNDTYGRKRENRRIFDLQTNHKTMKTIKTPTHNFITLFDNSLSINLTNGKITATGFGAQWLRLEECSISDLDASGLADISSQIVRQHGACVAAKFNQFSEN